MKIVKNLLFWISTVCFIAAILLIAVPKLFGVEFRAVLTGSMTPEIPVGSLVIIVPTNAENIKIGDDITFVTGGEKVVTHRVVKIDRKNNEFTTWGIANDPSAIDAPNKYENILGVVKIHIPRIGGIFSWIATLSGKIITATAIIAIYMLTFIIGIWTKGSKEKATSTDTSNGTLQKDNTTPEELLKSLDFENNLPKKTAPAKPDGILPAGDSEPPAFEDTLYGDSLMKLLENDEKLLELFENDDLFKKMLED